MNILYEDNHLIAVNKSTSDLVQGDKTGDQTLADRIRKYIAEKYNKPGDVFLGITHRLDRPVSGAVLFARTSKALERLNRMFREKEIDKYYLAIVKERPPEDQATITHFLKKNEKQNKSYAYDDMVKGSKEASLTYNLLARSDKYYLLGITLHTGRHHQIRCQFARIGCPIKGDLKYGYPRSNGDGGISLHARYISLIHPVKREKLVIIAPTPENDIWSLFNDFI
ncbi:MAG: RluA family pseudouridine synthase [Bacteroidales bacterium]|nr:RluA family pseudouridine synthase [Bacteroidales bacterium]